MSLLRRKLAANQRRLKRADRLRALEASGIRASAMGADAHENAVAALGRAAAPLALQPLAATDIAELLKSFGAGDLLSVLAPDLREEPGFVVSRPAFADAIARNPECFGPDGFVALDGANTHAVIVDIDDQDGLSCQAVPLPFAQDEHAQDQ